MHRNSAVLKADPAELNLAKAPLKADEPDASDRTITTDVVNVSKASTIKPKITCYRACVNPTPVSISREKPPEVIITDREPVSVVTTVTMTVLTAVREVQAVPVVPKAVPKVAVPKNSCSKLAKVTPTTPPKSTFACTAFSPNNRNRIPNK